LVNRSIKLTCFYQLIFFFFQAEDGIRDFHVTGVQTCALPISTRSKQALRTPRPRSEHHDSAKNRRARSPFVPANPRYAPGRSEEHTSELQSRENLVCRLLLEKKKNSRARRCTTRPRDRARGAR